MIRSDIRKPLAAGAPAVPPLDDGGADFGPLSRLGLWGGTAAVSLLAVAIATWTETGQARLAAAYAALTGNIEVADRRSAERAQQIEESRRTAETIRNLTHDRDRLLVRMTVLERNYEDVTGSIGKLSRAARAPGDAAAPAAAAAASANPFEPAPAASPPATTPASPAANPPASSTPGAAPAVATAPAVPEPQEPVSTKAEFGVDIGGGPTLASLRGAWDRARRNHARLLDGLRPVIAVRDGRGGQIELRLVVGPVGNPAAASQLCNALAAAGLSCQPSAFEGQRLSQR